MAKTNLRNLCRLISYLDGYAALSPVDPAKIQRLVRSETKNEGKKKRSSSKWGTGKSSAVENAALAASKEISRLWNEIRPDVSAISALPTASDEVAKASKRLGTIKRIFTVLAVAIIGFYLLIINSSLLETSSLVLRLGLVLGVVIAYYFVLYAYLKTNRRLGDLVAEYYAAHAGEVSSQRKRIRDATQRLIDVLAYQLRAREEDNDDPTIPEKYRISLLSRDYTNINVVRIEEKKVRAKKKGSNIKGANEKKKSASSVKRRYIVTIKGRKLP